jgi:membrane protease YdiL (CAAX protease family)
MLLSSVIAKPEKIGFPLLATATILADISLLCLVLYFVWRNREPLPSIGLTPRNVWREAALGTLLFVPLVLGMGLIEKALEAGGLSVPQKPPSFLVPSGGGQVALAVLLLIVVAISEEVVFRGYLIQRFKALLKNPVAALVLSSAVFSMGHGYERSGGVVGVGILGLIFGIVYLWRKSLAAPMVMHFMQNFAGIMLAPFGALT